jgi:hypothetical protein
VNSSMDRFPSKRQVAGEEMLSLELCMRTLAHDLVADQLSPAQLLVRPRLSKAFKQNSYIAASGKTTKVQHSLLSDLPCP